MACMRSAGYAVPQPAMSLASISRLSSTEDINIQRHFSSAEYLRSSGTATTTPSRSHQLKIHAKTNNSAEATQHAIRNFQAVFVSFRTVIMRLSRQAKATMLVLVTTRACKLCHPKSLWHFSTSILHLLVSSLGRNGSGSAAVPVAIILYPSKHFSSVAFQQCRRLALFPLLV